MAIDSVTLEILKNHSRAAAESMAFTLYRTAHSAFVKETEDFTTGLTTPEGETFATPTELGATWFVGLNYKNVIDLIDHYDEGDICLTNDPYSGYVCTHSPDMHIWKPVFHEGEIVCFVVGHIHNTDVGGAVPASLSRTLSEIHQEGVRIPPAKILRKGEVNDDVLSIMLANVRMPEQNWGDLKAQIASMNTGERKVHDMIAKFGIETFKEGIAALLDYAEDQARAIVRDLPDGQYAFADYMDEDVAEGYPCRIALNVTIDGDSLVFDLTGSDPQIEGSVNMPTGGEVRHALMMVGLVYVLYSLDKKLFLNSGISRVCRCILPTGTIVNPEFPAAVGLRTLSVQRLQAIIFGAFVQAAPDKLPASPASGGPIMNVNGIDNRTGRRVVASTGPIVGGAGGNPHEDGTEGSGANSSFLKNTPVEINEAEVPIKIVRYGLRPDSGGPGKFRGGMATVMHFVSQAPNTRITARNRDRTRFTSWGVLGGHAGATSQFLLNPGTNHEVNLGNTDILTIGPGDEMLVACGGAGGWGNPFERDPAAVLLDVQRGFVSMDSALQDYGVVIKDGAVDEAATTKLRASEPGKVNGAFYDYGSGRDAFEVVWTEANYAAMTELLAELPVHWRFFVKHRVFEAIEALDDDALKGDGSEIRTVFADVIARYPQLQMSA
ncbi:MAG: hydantoin utilization protein B [Rhodospirillaceae bacterium]|jgi:N-methylhydantoinase B|nr:hydantoin utilization protein B [Rhodospirillaceae bacterium]MBT6139124.1 hydantoin utilization protein B [Rhodospirillaceae bacterium]